ncbi:MAG: hypothetical protein K0Q50_2542 [Vampirovibrio sp.]|jgi:hypothetical protein|nr:hypothetical protein [Vampirovibrio sp.]
MSKVKSFSQYCISKVLYLYKLIMPLGIVTGLSGCQRGPSVDIFGSFFPVWFFCLLGGFTLTFIARSLLVRTRLDQDIGPLVIVYPCLTALFSSVLWLIFFS